jgi:hypothetical protein
MYLNDVVEMCTLDDLGGGKEIYWAEEKYQITIFTDEEQREIFRQRYTLCLLYNMGEKKKRLWGGRGVYDFF